MPVRSPWSTGHQPIDKPYPGLNKPISPGASSNPSLPTRPDPNRKGAPPEPYGKDKPSPYSTKG
ncbi:hypothetical protein SAMN05444161_3168 [Rhizobiales bacterium GAS191]|nr:hypothetical protein SAMN05444161_3168 [Rhizobiales bacterium GAS191]